MTINWSDLVLLLGLPFYLYWISRFVSMGYFEQKRIYNNRFIADLEKEECEHGVKPQ